MANGLVEVEVGERRSIPFDSGDKIETKDLRNCLGIAVIDPKSNMVHLNHWRTEGLFFEELGETSGAFITGEDGHNVDVNQWMQWFLRAVPKNAEIYLNGTITELRDDEPYRKDFLIWVENSNNALNTVRTFLNGNGYSNVVELPAHVGGDDISVRRAVEVDAGTGRVTFTTVADGQKPIVNIIKSPALTAYVAENAGREIINAEHYYVSLQEGDRVEEAEGQALSNEVNRLVVRLNHGTEKLYVSVPFGGIKDAYAETLRDIGFITQFAQKHNNPEIARAAILEMADAMMEASCYNPTHDESFKFASGSQPVTWDSIRETLQQIAKNVQNGTFTIMDNSISLAFQKQFSDQTELSIRRNSSHKVVLQGEALKNLGQHTGEPTFLNPF